MGVIASLLAMSDVVSSVTTVISIGYNCDGLVVHVVVGPLV